MRTATMTSASWTTASTKVSGTDERVREPSLASRAPPVDEYSTRNIISSAAVVLLASASIKRSRLKMIVADIRRYIVRIRLLIYGQLRSRRRCSPRDMHTSSRADRLRGPAALCTGDQRSTCRGEVRVDLQPSTSRGWTTYECTHS